ncbi:E3 ubiquitin-protein ligase TRAIP isoform X2 [Gopherus flavomarginatus]|uniref:E3 ubiquitin-protein ligase TRAIP isoform X2 n=1 Tax=Gopherus flavomarginatus TaxID=286002 RepID=UPI0021CBA37E|nr:E3 ubiquitin-protein ligase TRAIP isoform X2 [Gopherus flavomarginatus]
MPIRAHCTICSDFFDNHKDVAAIHCGHTFHQECLIQWFHTAPSRTCPQCRIQVSKRHIINKLFFDVALEEQTSLDAESIQNELDKVKAQLSMKEKEKRDCQSIIDTLRETVDVHSVTIESLQKALCETEMLCSTLKKQMKYLEQQQEETKDAKEEARRLRNKLKTMERIEMLLQSQRPEVEEMIRDMGIGQAAVEQLAVYCVSLKKEYENLKEARKASSEMTEKLKKELFSANNKSLKKKIGILQETLKVPSVTSETLSRLVFESPAPVELLSPKLHRPAHSNKMDLDTTFDVEIPEHQPHKSITTPAKKPKLDKKPPFVTNLAKKVLKETVENWAGEPEEDSLEEFFPAFIRNSVLSRKPPVGSLLGPHKNSGAVRMGYDGLGGRTKFIQPVSFPTICAVEISGQESQLCFPLIWVFPSDKPNGDPSLSCKEQEEECLQASIHNCSRFLLWHEPGKTGQLPSVNLKAFLVT